MLKFLWPFVYMIKMVNTVQFLLGLLSELVVFFSLQTIYIYILAKDNSWCCIFEIQTSDLRLAVRLMSLIRVVRYY